MSVAIAGAGIAGLTLGLTLHQIGVPFRIFEAVGTLKPLGVGINLQPNAVRELDNLGLAEHLDNIGIATRSLGFYTKTGLEIWTEPRGRHAGYNWPQYSVHRGALQMMLRAALIERAGADCLVTGHKAIGFDTTASEATLHMEAGGRRSTANAQIILAADGIHSALRAQMYPQEGAPVWGGAILWRGTSRMSPFLSGADMILAGHDNQRIVAYPISATDPKTGLATINWIAERRFDPEGGWRREDWNRTANTAEFLPHFRDWVFNWLDVPSMIERAEQVFEYPMVDRDPLPGWQVGRVTLMGDAAHPTYPVGSNGASQAIVDARVLGAAFLEHGLNEAALATYEETVRPRTTQVTLANRGSGPDAILQRVEDLCGGRFERIEDVLPAEELATHASRYKDIAGFGIKALNEAAPLIPPDAKLRRRE